jgi:hypothetical protein
MKIKRFYEMYEEKYNYDKILKSLKKTYGWGIGVINQIDNFESNDEYFENPIDDDDYIIKFNVYLNDLKTGKMRGQFNNTHALRLGKWKTGHQVDNPTSIYNKLY